MHFREDSTYLLKCLLVAHHILLVPWAFRNSGLSIFCSLVVGRFSPEECLRQITIQLLEVVQNFQLGFVFLKEKLQRILGVQMRLWKRCRSFYWLLWCAIEYFFKGLGISSIFKIVRRNCFCSRRILESFLRVLNRFCWILKVGIGFRPILQI